MSRTYSSAIIPVVALLGVIFLVLIAGTYVISTNKSREKSQSVMFNDIQPASVSAPLGQESSASAVPSASNSDKTGDIEEDLNNTEISDDPTLFMEVETDVSGL